MTSNIGEVIAALESFFIEKAKEATKIAAEQGKEMIVQKAKNFVQEYYSEYTPKMYSRIHGLPNSIVPFWSEKGDTLFEFGVTYTGDIGQHTSNSKYHQGGGAWISRDSEEFNNKSSDNGVPDSGWILNNYLAGVHPWEYLGVSPDEKMQDYFDNVLPGILNGIIEEYVMNALAGFF